MIENEKSGKAQLRTREMRGGRVVERGKTKMRPSQRDCRWEIQRRAERWKWKGRWSSTNAAEFVDVLNTEPHPAVHRLLKLPTTRCWVRCELISQTQFTVRRVHLSFFSSNHTAVKDPKTSLSYFSLRWGEILPLISILRVFTCLI